MADSSFLPTILVYSDIEMLRKPFTVMNETIISQGEAQPTLNYRKADRHNIQGVFLEVTATLNTFNSCSLLKYSPQPVCISHSVCVRARSRGNEVQ